MIPSVAPTTSATIKRLSYSSDKGTYSTVAGVTLYGFFEPLDPSQMPADVKMAQQGYRFFVDGASTVYASDMLTIDSVDYAVRGLRRYTAGSIDHLEILLEKSVRK